MRAARPPTGASTCAGQRRSASPRTPASSPLPARNFSASSAAMQPVPAAVTAWRKTLSCTSPAANTPGTRGAGAARRGHACSPRRPSPPGREDRRCSGVWPMATNTPSTGSPTLCRPFTSRSRTPVDRLRRAAADDLLDHAVPHHADLRVGEQPRLQDLLRPQRVAPVDQGDVVGVVGQVQRLLHRGVAAADHRHPLAAVEEPVAGGAGGDAAALQALLRTRAPASAPARRWR